MNDYNALLAGIITASDDDTAKLVFCDFLQERGAPEDAAWERYLRLELELSLHRRMGTFRPGEAPMSAGVYLRTGIELARRCDELWDSTAQFLDYYVWPTVGGATFQRTTGFYSRVFCTSRYLVENAANLIWHPSMNKDCPDYAHPIRHITITEVGSRSIDTYTVELWKEELAPKYGIKFEVQESLTVPTHEDLSHYQTSVPNPPEGCVVVRGNTGQLITLAASEPLKVGHFVALSKMGCVYRLRRRRRTQVIYGTVVAVHNPEAVASAT